LHGKLSIFQKIKKKNQNANYSPEAPDDRKKKFSQTTVRAVRFAPKPYPAWQSGERRGEVSPESAVRPGGSRPECPTVPPTQKRHDKNYTRCPTP
jgi:hypothetical protein